MTKELVSRMSYAQCERAYKAYTDLACVYEDVCNGPFGAKAYKEYFAIMDSRDNIRARVVELANIASHGKQ